MESARLLGLCIYTKDEEAEISVMGATRTVQRELNLVQNLGPVFMIYMASFWFIKYQPDRMARIQDYFN